MDTQIVRDRPVMPKDYGVPEGDDGLLPWSHVVEHMESAKNYWIATVRPNGTPHLSAVWGVWLDDAFFFDGSPQTRRGKNIAHNPAVAVHLGSGDDVLILEGVVTDAPPDDALALRLSEAYKAKYAALGYSPEPDQWTAGIYRAAPRTVIAFTQFPPLDATRWRFGE